MAALRLLFVAIVGLLAACATCAENTAAIASVPGSPSLDAGEERGFSVRDLLRKKKKTTKKISKRRVRKAKSEAINQNDEGVLINQQTSANIKGNDNTVVGGETAPIGNFQFDIGDIDLGRKLRKVEGESSRDLLRRRKKKKVVKKKRVRSAKSEAATANVEGVAINQQTTANIKGDANEVIGGTTAPIGNLNFDIGDIDLGRKLMTIEGGVDRDLLRKKKKKVVKRRKRNVRKAKSEAVNINDEGVLINQQTTANIDGDGNTVEGGFTAPIVNANVDLGDIFVDK